MSVSVFERTDKNPGYQRGALRQISQWSAECKSMKFYEVEELERHPIGILAYDEEVNELLGHVAITEIDEDQRARLGALVVNKAYKRAGVASALIRHILEVAPEVLPHVSEYYAFVHSGSLNSFLENGAQITGRREPPAITGCNTIVSINPADLTSTKG